MSIKLIADIRLIESDVPNIDGNSSPSYIGKIYRYDHMKCSNIIQRLLFMLRYRGFVFEGFDHLYLNFTPCISHGEIRDANRCTIREFSWFHYVDVGCDVEIFNSLSIEEKNSFIMESAKKASLMKATTEQRELFEKTFKEVIQSGERLLVPYKQKENQNYRVDILVRITDESSYIPLIRVVDKNGTLKAEQELRFYRFDEFIFQIGTIVIGKNSIRITPRKNSYTEYYNLSPIIIHW